MKEEKRYNQVQCLFLFFNKNNLKKLDKKGNFFNLRESTNNLCGRHQVTRTVQAPAKPKQTGLSSSAGEKTKLPLFVEDTVIT